MNERVGRCSVVSQIYEIIRLELRNIPMAPDQQKSSHASAGRLGSAADDDLDQRPTPPPAALLAGSLNGLEDHRIVQVPGVADQLLPDVQSDSNSESNAWDVGGQEQPEPLIDLVEAWEQLGSADEESAKVLSDAVAAELTYYLHATRAGGLLERRVKMEYSGIEEEFRVDVAHDIAENTEENANLNQDVQSQEPDAQDEYESGSLQHSGEKEVLEGCMLENSAKTPTLPVQESDNYHHQDGTQYGEELLMALACEDKRPQKAVPQMTYAALTSLLTETAVNTSRLCNESRHGHISHALAASLTLNVLPAFVYTLVEAAERQLDELASACRTILICLADIGNPREFHVMLKSALSRISPSCYKEIVTLIISDLLRMWKAVIPRIRGKRALFLRDVVEVLDTIVFARSFDMLPVENSSGGIDLKTTLEVEVLTRDFVDKMAQVQVNQMRREIALDDTRLLEAYSFQSVPESVPVQLEITTTPRTTGTSSKSAKNLAKKALASARNIANDKERIRQDFDTERGASLALLLKLGEHAMDKFEISSGKELGSSKERRRPGRLRSSKHNSEVEQFLISLIPVFRNLGFDNPVDACQQCYQLLGIDTFSERVALVRDMSRPAQARKRKSETFFSFRTFVCYLIVEMCLPDNGCSLSHVDHVSSSPFSFLEPHYAFELTLPYLMTAIADSNPVMILQGIQLLQGFLSRIPDNSIQTLRDGLSNVYKLSFMQTESSWVGLVGLLAKATGRLDDPKHRGFAYEVTQAVLKKLKSPEARFVILAVVLLEAERAAMSAQLITEIKDAIRLIDSTCDAGVADQYRTRFVETCLPRYFLPRKEMLAALNPTVAACNAGLFMALSDSKKISCNSGDKYHTTRMLRMQFSQLYMKLGREAVRAIAAVSEHDRRTIPESKLAKSDAEGARSLYDAAGKTLNDCVAAISSLDYALDALSKALHHYEGRSKAI